LFLRSSGYVNSTIISSMGGADKTSAPAWLYYRIGKTDLDAYDFSFEMTVRDYECDMQGIVNNAVYQNYLEHVRHEYLRSIGIDFKFYTENRINLVVTRAELDYKYPLGSGDRFVVRLRFRRESRIRFVFFQDIYRIPDNKLSLKGKIVGVALNSRGRPYVPEEFRRIFCAKSA